MLLRHPGVQKALAIAHSFESGEKRLVAYVVLNPAKPARAQDLRAFARENLPDYMVPSAIVELDSIPLTANGKVDRNALPVPDPVQEDSANFVAPRNPIEQALAGIWAELLHLPKVGIHDDFFDLGGHSLLATRVVSRIRDAFDVEVPLRSLFETPTVCGLADVIASSGKNGRPRRAPAIIPVPRDEKLPLSFAQQRLWFINQMAPVSPAYNVPSALRFRGDFDIPALRRSLNEIVRRHEVLRTSFRNVDGHPVQMIAKDLGLDIPLVDLTRSAEAEREAERLMSEEAKRAFDMVRGPLIRCAVYRLAEKEHLLLLTLHHIVSDGWSRGLLFQELTSVYEAFRKGARSPLPELPVQYADFAHWQRQWLQGGTLDHLLAFWKKTLAGAPASVRLPTDHARPAVQSFSGAKHSVSFTPSFIQSLNNASRRYGATPFMVMVAALKILLLKWTGQTDLVVGTVIANRNQSETERLIGCFMNFMPLRTRVADVGNAVALLEQIRTSVLEAYAHQDCPFERLIEAINPERRLNLNPIYNVVFLLQNYPGGGRFGDALEVDARLVDTGSSLLDLRFIAEESADGMNFCCEYDTDLFDAATIRHLVDSYCAVLERLLSEPRTSLADFKLSPELEAQAQRAREREQTIAITATFTAEPLAESLEYWMKELRVSAAIEFAPYNQVFQQLLDPGSLLGANKSGVNVVLIRHEDWSRNEHGYNVALEDSAQAHVSELVSALRQAATRNSTPCLVCVCPLSPHAAADAERARRYGQLDSMLRDELGRMSGVHLVTSDDLSKFSPDADC